MFKLSKPKKTQWTPIYSKRNNIFKECKINVVAIKESCIIFYTEMLNSFYYAIKTKQKIKFLEFFFCMVWKWKANTIVIRKQFNFL